MYPLKITKAIKITLSILILFVDFGTPHNLRVTETNFTVIELSWERPNPSNVIITNYMVCYFKTSISFFRHT